MLLGEKLKKLRKARGLSQEQLADQLNVSRQAISKWELGESTPDTDNLVIIMVCRWITYYVIKKYLKFLKK